MSKEKAPLTQTEAITLMELLTTDPVFRQEFQSNPATALARISKNAANSAQECSMPGELASIEDMTIARDRMIEHLTSTSIFSIAFCFVDGRTSN